jgi:hypothetical protein
MTRIRETNKWSRAHLPAAEYHCPMDDPKSNEQINEPIGEQIEAAVFRRLVEHLDERKDVQNIDLMNLAGFCRNCLSKWYTAACEEAGVEMDYESARERVYGMPYAEWKDRYQSEASAEQLAKFDESRPRDG